MTHSGRDVHNHRHRSVDQPRAKRAYLRLDPEDRLVLHMAVDALGCWNFTGKLNPGGYGTMPFQGRTQGTHRVAYLLWVGAIPEGLDLDHLCRNRRCFNPAHLEPVTRFVNAMRGIPGAVKHRTHCLHGHELTPGNTYFDQGKRRCRQCNRERQQRFQTKRKEVA